MKHISARVTRLAGALTLAVAAALGGTGIASASANPAKSGTEQFYLTTTSGTATTIPIIADGVFTAAGTDDEGNAVDTVKLPRGTFQVNHSGANGTPKVNPVTCFFTLTETGPIKIGHGTGAYRGISGSGWAVVSVVAIMARSRGGVCLENADPVAYQQTVRATAQITL